RTVDQTNSAAIVLMVVDRCSIRVDGVVAISCRLITIRGVRNSVPVLANRVDILAFLQDAVVARGGTIDVFHIILAAEIRVTAAVGNIKHPAVLLWNVGGSK